MAAEKEMLAHDMVRRRNWARAAALYDQLISAAPGSAQSTRVQKDQQIACLLGRCECLLELGKYEGCLADAYKVLTLLAEQTECLASVSRARRWLVHALFKMHKYGDAEIFLSKWINELSGQQIFSDISKTLERYKSIIQMIMNGQHKAQAQKIPHARLEDEMAILDTKLDHWATNNLPLDKYSKLLSNKGLKKREQQQQQQHQQQQNGTGSGSGSYASSSSNSSTGSSSTISSSNSNLHKTNDLLAAMKLTAGKHQPASADGPSLDAASGGDQAAPSTTCSYCAINFLTRNELRQHCQTEAHQKVIMSDEAGNPLLNDKPYNNLNMHINVGSNNAGVAGTNGLLSNGNSVPLYRRQALTGNGTGIGNSCNNMPGLDTSTNLIEALFHANNAVADHSVKSSDHVQGLLYNNFNALKGGHEMDLFQSMPLPVPHSEANNHHHQQQQASSAATTYAAVLSQGPQAASASSGVGVGQTQSQAQAAPTAKSSQAGIELLEKDPFAAIRELGQATTGFYNYFQ